MLSVLAERRPDKVSLNALEASFETARVASLHRAVLLFVRCRRSHLMKIAVTLPRPRNPLVGAAKFRRAGAHREVAASRRQHAARSLRRELTEMKHIP
jgi:hypothetical protein